MREVGPIVALLIAVAACGEAGAAGPAGGEGTTGPAGAAGTAGATGPAGPQGEPGAKASGGLVWKDRTGAIVRVVSHVATSNSNYDLLIADSAGYVWVADSVGRFAPILDATAPTLYFASNDCTGAGYIDLVLPPRYVVKFASDAGAYRAIPSDVAPTALVYGSSMTIGQACTPGGGTTRPAAVPFTSTLPATAIVKPAALFAPPTHPEFL